MNDLSERRLAENEVIFKQINDEVKELVLDGGPDGQFADKEVMFYCECSNMDCHERIKLSAKEYDAIHSNPKRFVLRPGHDTPEIETLVDNRIKYIVIEKLFAPPVPQNVEPKRLL